MRTGCCSNAKILGRWCSSWPSLSPDEDFLFSSLPMLVISPDDKSFVATAAPINKTNHGCVAPGVRQMIANNRAGAASKEVIANTMRRNFSTASVVCSHEGNRGPKEDQSLDPVFVGKIFRG